MLLPYLLNLGMLGGPVLPPLDAGEHVTVQVADVDAFGGDHVTVSTDADAIGSGHTTVQL
jgi:hypothetical protein